MDSSFYNLTCDHEVQIRQQGAVVNVTVNTVGQLKNVRICKKNPKECYVFVLDAQNLKNLKNDENQNLNIATDPSWSGRQGILIFHVNLETKAVEYVHTKVIEGKSCNFFELDQKENFLILGSDEIHTLKLDPQADNVRVPVIQNWDYFRLSNAQGQMTPITCGAFNPFDNTMYTVGNHNYTVDIFQYYQRKPLAHILLHHRPVVSVVFKDFNVIISSSRDNTIASIDRRDLTKSFSLYRSNKNGNGAIFGPLRVLSPNSESPESNYIAFLETEINVYNLEARPTSKIKLLDVRKFDQFLPLNQQGILGGPSSFFYCQKFGQFLTGEFSGLNSLVSPQLGKGQDEKWRHYDDTVRIRTDDDPNRMWVETANFDLFLGGGHAPIIDVVYDETVSLMAQITTDKILIAFL